MCIMEPASEGGTAVAAFFRFIDWRRAPSVSSKSESWYTTLASSFWVALLGWAFGDLEFWARFFKGDVESFSCVTRFAWYFASSECLRKQVRGLKLTLDDVYYLGRSASLWTKATAPKQEIKGSVIPHCRTWLHSPSLNFESSPLLCWIEGAACFSLYVHHLFDSIRSDLEQHLYDGSRQSSD